MSMREEYAQRRKTFLLPVAQRLEDELNRILKGARFDRISVRAKDVESFERKAAKEEDGKLKYSEPLAEIQDQIGARVVTFYLSDVEAISARLNEYYRSIETRTVVPDSESEFGYFGKHFILLIPSELKTDLPEGVGFFELQIKTLFQHAWSEANHDLAYKPTTPLTSAQKRKVAFSSAQAWGADMIFEELRSELSQ